MEDKAKMIKKQCLQEKSQNPIEIAQRLMANKAINMHGPEHHILDGAAFLTALYHAGMNFDLEKALNEIIIRGQKMPGATCGQWGVCGSASSLGAALAIINGTGPLSSGQAYQDNLLLTSRILNHIGQIGGPRCCKRNAWIALYTAIDFVEERYGIKLAKTKVTCPYSKINLQCLHAQCPFSVENPYHQKSEKIIFRKMNYLDYEHCAIELKEAFKDEPWKEAWTKEMAYQRIQEIMSAPVARGIVAIQEGKVVSMLCGRIMTYLDKHLLFIDEFSVHPQMQGQHLGEQMMDYVKEEMAKERIEHFSLMTEKEFPCVKFYEKQGFESEEHSLVMSYAKKS